MNEFDYLNEKHLQTDAEEPEANDILGAIGWADIIAVSMTTDELCIVVDDPEWESPYAEDIR